MDVFSKEKRSEVMRRIRSKNTKPELKVRKELHSRGYRFRLHCKELPGKPDIVLPKFRTAIQVRGCFWHGHDCKDGHIPKTRNDYWVPKIAGNKRRDLKNDRKLRAMGWTVIVVWACRVEPTKGLERSIHRITKILKRCELIL